MPPREILVTGATGVLGSELVGALLADPETKVWLLLRARSRQELGERRQGVIAYARASVAGDLESRVRAVRGDVALPLLGMDPEDYACVAASVTHVVHAAADVRLDRSIDDARRTAIGGIENAIEIMRKARSSRIRKLDYVSTVGVAGRRRGWILEEPQPLGGHGFRNAYEQSKAEAEELLLSAISEGLPATIHRPTMIVGNSVTGRIRSYHGFYFLVDFFLGLKGDRIVPECNDIRMDTVPVDYVARAIDHSTCEPRFNGKILHLCSGPAASSIGEIVARARALLLERGDLAPSVTRIALERFSQHLSSMRAKRSRLHEALSQFEPYFEDRIEFDNRQATALLQAAQIELPPVASYLGPVLSAYWDERPSVAR
jgi:thioester reductase-like protein